MGGPATHVVVPLTVIWETPGGMPPLTKHGWYDSAALLEVEVRATVVVVVVISGSVFVTVVPVAELARIAAATITAPRTVATAILMYVRAGSLFMVVSTQCLDL